MNPNYLSLDQARKLNNSGPDMQLALVGDRLRLALNGSIGFRQNARLYVDGITGNDSNNGYSWESAFKTIQAACNKARYINNTTTIDTTKNRDIYVFIAPGQYNEQVLFSGYNIHLIGCGPLSNGDYGVVINYDDAITSTAVVGFSGSGLEISNICINGAHAIPLLLLSDVSDACWVHDCWLKGDNSKTVTIGISCSIKNSIIENNRINGCKTGINVGAGAWFNNSIIRKHKITNVTNILNVDATAVATESEISENSGVGSSTGIVNASSNDILIYGNHTKPAISDGGSTAGDNTTLA